MTVPLLYRAACRGVFGERRAFGRGGIADALFVYLDGRPDAESLAVLEERYRARAWVCLTDEWEAALVARHPDMRVFQRWQMKSASRFRFPEAAPIPAGCRVAEMDGIAFDLHPFSHGVHYASYADFRKDGAGAVAWRGGQIVASASSYISMDGEVELDVSTVEPLRGRGLASACVARMLRDCAARGIVVHWDAQNEASRRLAAKFGFETECAYSVYWLEKGDEKEGNNRE